MISLKNIKCNSHIRTITYSYHLTVIKSIFLFKYLCAIGSMFSIFNLKKPTIPFWK